MSVIPTNKYFQCTFRFEGTAVPTGAAVVFGVGTVDVEDVDAIAASVAAAWDDGHMDDLYVADCTLKEVLVKQGPNDTGPQSLLPVNADGNASGDAGYAGAALLIQKNTGLGGRSNRGRMYLPGIAEAAIDEGGVVESGYLSSAQTVATQFLNELSAPDSSPHIQSPMVVLHSSGSEAPPQVLSLVVSSVMATQRNRQRR